MDQGRPIVDRVTKALGMLSFAVPASFQRLSRQFLEKVALCKRPSLPRLY